MTFQSANQPSAPNQGWASTYRDYRALMSCDSEIDSDSIQQILGIEQSHCDLLSWACCRDSEGKLLVLSDFQFDLIHEAERSMQGMLCSFAVELIKAGKERLINEEWLDLATLYQLLSDYRSKLFYEGLGHKDPDLEIRIRTLDQWRTKISREFWLLTGFGIH